MMKKHTIYVMMVLAAVINIASAEIITVDLNGFYDFDNIQDAINYSWNGDTVIVRPGTYNGSIYFNGRAITLTSIDPDDAAIVASTTLTSGGNAVVYFNFAENLDSVLAGFTVVSQSARAIYCMLGATPTIIKNVISGYYGVSNAGGIICNNIISGGYTGIETIENCVISNNTITGNTTGISVRGNIGIVKNNIMASNNIGLEQSGGGVCLNLFNCFWVSGFGAGVVPGPGDINVDPLFVSNGWWDSGTWRNGDYHLKSEAGRCLPDGETWVMDDVTSRCIDGGDPNDFIDIEPNSNGGIINIGCYGGTAEASKSTSGIIASICPIPPMADINNDCKVDLDDFGIMVLEWLEDRNL